MPVRAFVAGCQGYVLTGEECAFLAETQPWGLILFKRNVESPEQLKALTARFREAVGRDAPVLIDQEGGRVQRLGPPHWASYPAPSLYESAGESDDEAARLGGRLIAGDLSAVGISIDCAPVLDVPAPGSHQVVGNRAFSADPQAAGRLARSFADGLIQGGVLPVIKHIPGHGRATVDSHLELPVVTAGRAELEAVDFVPFRALSDLPAAMTAHVVYTAIDPDRPATTSRIIHDSIIRGALGFRGLLFSDDLSMEALKGTLGERAEAAAAAGCDIILHCNGKLDEARQVASMARPLDGAAADRAQAALAAIKPAAAPAAAERARFAALMRPAA